MDLHAALERLATVGLRSTCTVEATLDSTLWVSFQHMGNGIVDVATNVPLNPTMERHGWTPDAEYEECLQMVLAPPHQDVPGACLRLLNETPPGNWVVAEEGQESPEEPYEPLVEALYPEELTEAFDEFEEERQQIEAKRDVVDAYYEPLIAQISTPLRARKTLTRAERDSIRLRLDAANALRPDRPYTPWWLAELAGVSLTPHQTADEYVSDIRRFQGSLRLLLARLEKQLLADGGGTPGRRVAELDRLWSRELGASTWDQRPSLRELLEATGVEPSVTVHAEEWTLISPQDRAAEVDWAERLLLYEDRSSRPQRTPVGPRRAELQMAGTLHQGLVLDAVIAGHEPGLVKLHWPGGGSCRVGVEDEFEAAIAPILVAGSFVTAWIVLLDNHDGNDESAPGLHPDAVLVGVAPGGDSERSVIDTRQGRTGPGVFQMPALSGRFSRVVLPLDAPHVVAASPDEQFRRWQALEPNRHATVVTAMLDRFPQLAHPFDERAWLRIRDFGAELPPAGSTWIDVVATRWYWLRGLEQFSPSTVEWLGLGAVKLCESAGWFPAPVLARLVSEGEDSVGDKSARRAFYRHGSELIKEFVPGMPEGAELDRW